MLASSADLSQLASLKQSEDGVYALTYEVIHSHAFKVMPKEKTRQGDQVVKVPLSKIVLRTSPR